MRSTVGVEHPPPHACTSGCIVPLVNVHYGLEVGRLTGRLASKMAAATRAQAGGTGSKNGVLVMAHEPLTRGAGPRYVRGHRGVLVIALQSVAFGADPRCVREQHVALGMAL